MTASQGRSVAKAGPAETIAARADARRHHPGSAERAAAFSDMQCAAGNLAVQQLFRSGVIQAKLTISQPDDREEQEADRVAEHVVAIPTAGTGHAGGAFAGGIGLHADLMAARPVIRRAATGDGGGMARRGIESAPSFGGGRPLEDPARTFMEARFGRDFTAVRIHADGEAAASARALNARAYTLGRDIVFASGEYLPESGEGRRLLAHELAHVVQQDQEARPTIIRRQQADAPAPSPASGAAPPPPAATAGGQPTADHPAGLIVEDSTQDVAPGQMKRGQFLSQLRAAVYSTAEQAVASSPMAAAIRPQMNQEIERQFSLYSGLDARSLENTIRQRVPGAAGVAAANAFIPLICEQVRQTIAANLPNEGGQAGVAGTVMGAVDTVAQGVGDVVASVGSVLFKAREGGARRPDGPHAIRAQLGSGHALDGGLRSGMGAAFGHDFSSVRVHSDAGAARLADKLNARAFTYGQDIAFGTGEYRPGTLIGDALIAHELAHVVQQSGAGSVRAPASTDAANEKAFESDADMAAVGAMISLWARAQGGMVKIAQNAMPALRSGLRLRPFTCPWDSPSPAPTPPSATPSATPSAAPDAGVPRPETLDEFMKKHSAQDAVNKAVNDVGVDTKLMEDGFMHFRTIPSSIEAMTFDKHHPHVIQVYKKSNELPLTEVYDLALKGGWPLLHTTVFHEFQHLKRGQGSGNPAGELEAYCHEMIRAEKENLHLEDEILAPLPGQVVRTEKQTGEEYIEKTLWRRLQEKWNKVRELRILTKDLEKLHSDAEAAKNRMIEAAEAAKKKKTEAKPPSP
jgi:hypothetical protein